MTQRARVLLVHNARSDKAKAGHALVAEALARAGAEVDTVYLYDLTAALDEAGNYRLLTQEGKTVNAHIICNRVSTTNFRPALVKSLAALGVPSVNSLGLDLDKFSAALMLASKGVRVPAQSLPGLQWWRHIDGSRLVAKPCVGTQGVGVHLLPERFEPSGDTTLPNGEPAFSGSNGEYLLQRFIPSAARFDMRIVVVDDVVVAAMRRDAQAGEFRTNLAQGGVGSAYIPTPDEQQIARKAASALGLVIAGVDIAIDEDGEPIVLEVNSNPEMGSAQFSLETYLPDAIAAAVLQRA